jgi:hypothetical protein
LVIIYIRNLIWNLSNYSTYIYITLQIVSPPPHPRLDTMSSIKAPHIEDFLGGVRLLSDGYVVRGDGSVLALSQATFPNVLGVPMPSTKRQRV